MKDIKSPYHKLHHLIEEKCCIVGSLRDALSASALPCISFAAGAVLFGYLEKGGDLASILKTSSAFITINTWLIYPIGKLIEYKVAHTLNNERVVKCQQLTDKQLAFIKDAQDVIENKAWCAVITNPVSAIICWLLYNDGGVRIMQGGAINFDPPALILLALAALCSSIAGAVSIGIIDSIKHYYCNYDECHDPALQEMHDSVELQA